ncbi:hypothetical protein NDN08_005641 [Rhodosorus marinus]|uniref:G domain-containing protein n=1 Tax=Rhodosorus marinus TaxID=101924 RepID=A0AAV8V448_9RHOD|nr:hypothetical protein NDN08_005641 [Rhodosorus marinus]
MDNLGFVGVGLGVGNGFERISRCSGVDEKVVNGFVGSTRRCRVRVDAVGGRRSIFSEGEWEDEVNYEEGGVIPWSANVPNKERAGEVERIEPVEEVIDEEGFVLREIDYELNGIDFRDEFRCKRNVEWWDAPMKKTMREIRDMNLIEVMIEIRDMRLPKTGTHPLFRVWRREKNFQTVVVYTHVENFSMEERETVKDYTIQELNIPEDHIFFEDLRNCKKYRTKLLRPACAKIKELMLQNGFPVKQQVKKALVVGVPNVGKSSFIYIVSKELTKKKKKKKLYHAPVVADHAGETIRTKSYWFNEKPNLMLIDTPGLFPPASSIKRDLESPYKLAAAKSCNLPHIAREFDFMQVEVADYILFKLNEAKKFYYVERYGLKQPTDRIHRVLNHMDGNTDKQNALKFVDDFNAGYLGALCFDDLSVEEVHWEEEEEQYELKPFVDRRQQPQQDLFKKEKKPQSLILKSDFWRNL